MKIFTLWEWYITSILDNETSYDLIYYLSFLYPSLFQAGGMQEGDFVVGINSDDVKWAPHDQVVTMIKVSLLTRIDEFYA